MSMSVSGLDTGASRVDAAKMQQTSDMIIQLAAKAENIDSTLFAAAIAGGENQKAALAEGVGESLDVSA